MKRGIRTKLLAAFFLANAVLIIGSVGLIIVHNRTVGRYAQIIDTMSVGHQLDQAVADLIDTYNNVVLENSSSVNSSGAKITSITSRIDQNIAYLDQAIVDPKARVSFVGLKNSINQVVDEVRKGLADASQDKPTAFSHYQAAHHYYDFVQTNSTTFTLDQLSYIDTVRHQLHATYVRSEIASSSFLLVVAGATVAYGFMVARRIVRPLGKLTEAATAVSSGQLNVTIDPQLIHRNDEIGSLSHSFNFMLQGLKEKIEELNVQKATAEAERAKDEAILGSIGDAMIVTDSSGNVLLINSIAAEMLELDRTNIIGKSAFDSYQLYDESGNVLSRQDRPFYTALYKGQKNSQNLAFINKNGDRLALSITATPVRQQGKTIGGIEIVRNMTKEKEIDRMKTEFISLASHQLRTPLSAIKWFTEMLVSGDAGSLNPDQKEFAANIMDSTERMISLVNSLLNISRIESGRIIVDPKPTDLKELVHSVIKDLTAKVQEREQTIAVSVHDDLPFINIDRQMIGQVYLNLLTNAIKYTPKRGEISVFVSRKDDFIVSQVTDNGYGIPVAQQSKMFQKFFRASNVAKVETDGTGLGLYLVKAIVESSGGKIWFESTEGQGTTFWFSLPMSGMQAKAGEVVLEGGIGASDREAKAKTPKPVEHIPLPPPN